MMMSRIEEYLDELFNEPKCELNYTKDYELLIAIMLSAQSTDKRVNSVTPILFEKYPSLNDLKNADITDLEEIIRSVGSFRKKSLYIKGISRMLDEECGGVVPTDREYLESMPGIGRKTTNVFLSEFYNYPAIAVDTHVFRVSNRLGLADSDNVLEVEKQLQAELPKKEWSLTHHLLIFHGRRCCIARNPKCNECPLTNRCKYFKEQKAKKK